MPGKNLGQPVRANGVPERRRGRRFPLRMGCRVTPVRADSREWVGWTSDISRSGVRVVFDNAKKKKELPGVGMSMRILIDLPHSFHISPRCLECLGVTVRTERAKSGRFAAAFAIRRIRVCDRSGQTPQLGDSSLTDILPPGPSE